MESTVIDVLLNGSPMAAFAVFLIYLYRTQQGRMDALVDKFQKQLETARHEYKKDVEDLRDRYDSVIDGQNSERDRIKTGIEIKLKEVHSSLSIIQGSCQSLAVSHEVTKDDLVIIAKNVEHGLEIIKMMQEEAKLKEIARQALQNREPK